jgi:hypothetical protein
MYFVSEKYQSYENSAVNNELTEAGIKGNVCWDEGKSVEGVQGSYVNPNSPTASLRNPATPEKRCYKYDTTSL